MTDRIPTELWVTAHLRQCAAKAVPVYVVRRGEPDSGTVMVKLVRKDRTCKLLSQSRDIDGNMGWMDVFGGEAVDERKADEYIARTVSRDPVVWVVEVEGDKSPFEGKIL
jgi:hypothetical protein